MLIIDTMYSPKVDEANVDISISMESSSQWILVLEAWAC